MKWNEVIHESNSGLVTRHALDWESLAEQILHRGGSPEAVIDRLMELEIAVPSWGVCTGGTRFGRFPGPGEPRNVFEKLEDVQAIHLLTGSTPRVSLHIPWDRIDRLHDLKYHADSLGLGFDAVNSNTFEDQQGQPVSYKFGSLSHTDKAVRDLAVQHNIEVIEVGKALGSRALSIWIADGSSYPGQSHFRRAFERALDSYRRIYEALPSDWRVFIEHKPFEPACYSTVVADWGISYAIASALGKKAACLVDLGHTPIGGNVEQTVAMLIQARKLAGFHFNDCKYADDDLTAGSINPYQLFLVFVELVLAAEEGVPDFDPAYLIDQSHNVKDPLEDLVQTVGNLQSAYARALLVDREALARYQESNDVLMAELTLQEAFQTDVRPLIAEARRRKGAALNPLAAFRASGYRSLKAKERPQSEKTSGTFQ